MRFRRNIFRGLRRKKQKQRQHPRTFWRSAYLPTKKGLKKFPIKYRRRNGKR